MTIGIFSRTFTHASFAECLASASAAGYDGVHLSLASVGLDSLPESIPDGLGERVKAQAAKQRMKLLGVSATFNAAHSSQDYRREHTRRAGLLIKAARGMGIDVVSICTGSRSEKSMWEFHPDNAGPAAWADARRTISELAKMAQDEGVVLGMEPEPANVVASAELAERMLDEVGSEAIRVILDPANLISVPGGVEAQERILGQAFERLARYTGIVHAKDNDAAGSMCAPGEGVVNFPLVFELIRKHRPGVSVVTHNLPESAAARTAAFLKQGLKHDRGL